MLATRSLVASTILAAAAALTVVPVGSSAADPTAPSSPSDHDQAPEPSRDDVAEAAAADVIASRAPQLYLSRYDKVQAKKTLRSSQLRFVPYERTYRGLPVIGGDFVVVVDSGGNVVHTSVAQTAKVSLPDVRASVPATTARTRTAGKVDNARLGRSQLVVLQRGSRSDLAWRTTATGQKAGKPSRLDVFVDADSGEVLKTQENVLYGDGNAGWSGPNPVPIQTRKIGATYDMTMKTAPTLTCQDLATLTTFSGPDDVWGDGNPATRETGCVDAFYAAQQMNKMMASWLGRTGMNGSNGWLPIRIGLNQQNAFYDGTQVQFGFNPSGQWVSSLDVTGHEFGHGVDHHTPGGISRAGTQEFIADTFGTSTEWFDNQPAANDPRDFLVGEEVNLAGHAEIRNMFNPSAEGHPNCYSAAIGTNPNNVHNDAGPGDHWFYIASQGTNPAGGPSSTTCNATTQLGIGIQKVMKVLYTAMLMKDTSSSYPKYRQWTLLAARHLYGQANCTEFNRIKAAWNAVSVPALPGEATCTKNAGAVTVTNATSRTAVAGSPFTPFTMTATGGTGPYTWTATGLPTGLSINASTGQVSGSLNKDTSGVWVVKVTATGTVGGTGEGHFTFQVTSPTTPACSGQRLGNFDFELPSDAPWTAFSGKIGPHGASSSRTGVKHAWLGGYGATTNHLGTRIDTLTQSVTVPAGCKATLVFYVWSLTNESTVTTVFDTLTVKAGSTTLVTRSNLDAIKFPACGSCPKTYVKVTKVLPGGLAGTTFDLSFNTNEDSSLFTNWHVDDVTLKISPP